MGVEAKGLIPKGEGVGSLWFGSESCSHRL